MEAQPKMKATMTPDQFCYWLQGFFELCPKTDATGLILNLQQTNMVREHLDLVFDKVTGATAPSVPPESKRYCEPKRLCSDTPAPGTHTFVC